MKRNNSFEEIFEKIKSSENILIPLHKGPDGDSLGCCVAMKYFLERDFKKKVKVISKDELSVQLKDFNFVKEIKFGKGLEDIELKKFDLILFLDHAELNYGLKDDLNLDFPLEKNSVNIDHHPTNSYFARLNYVDSSRSSACSVLLDFFKEMKVRFDKELSTRLLLGIYTDSGGFTHDKGGALKDAVFLIDKGADYLEGIVNTIRYNVPLNLKKYYSFLVEKFEIVNFGENRVGVCSVSEKEAKKFRVNLAEVRSGIATLQEIEGVDFLFTLNEMDDLIKGSFRSRDIDVSLFAKELGGGGHKLAAAFRLERMPMKKAEKKVFEAIKKVGVHKVK